jgi:uncharacterized protein
MLSPTPLLMVHGSGDQAVPPADAQAAFEAVGEPKKLVWVDARNHVDIYDQEELVEPTADAAAEWFHRYLGRGRARRVGMGSAEPSA